MTPLQLWKIPVRSKASLAERWFPAKRPCYTLNSFWSNCTRLLSFAKFFLSCLWWPCGQLGSYTRVARGNPWWCYERIQVWVQFANSSSKPWVKREIEWHDTNQNSSVNSDEKFHAQTSSRTEKLDYLRHFQVHIWRIIAVISGLCDKPITVLNTRKFTWKVKLISRSSGFVKSTSVSLRVRRRIKRLLWDKCFDINGDIAA